MHHMGLQIVFVMVPQPKNMQQHMHEIYDEGMNECEIMWGCHMACICRSKAGGSVRQKVAQPQGRHRNSTQCAVLVLLRIVIGQVGLL